MFSFYVTIFRVLNISFSSSAFGYLHIYQSVFPCVYFTYPIRCSAQGYQNSKGLFSHHRCQHTPRRCLQFQGNFLLSEVVYVFTITFFFSLSLSGVRRSKASSQSCTLTLSIPLSVHPSICLPLHPPSPSSLPSSSFIKIFRWSNGQYGALKNVHSDTRCSLSAASALQ